MVLFLHRFQFIIKNHKVKKINQQNLVKVFRQFLHLVLKFLIFIIKVIK